MKLSMLENMDFSFENSMTASCLKITSERREQFVEYQMEMLESNDIPGLLSFHSILRDDKLCLYYDITSQLTLAQLLSKKKLSCRELICLLRNITKVFIECRSYLLSDKCLLIDEKMIYVNPQTLGTRLLYLPIIIDCDSGSCFREFLTRMMLDLVVIEDPNADALIHKIIGCLRIKSFSLNEFYKLVNTLTDDNIGECPQEPIELSETDEHNDRNVHREPSDPGNAVKKSWVYERSNIFIAVLSQILIVILIYSASGFLNSLGGNVILTYCAVAIIVGAIDILIYRAVFTHGKADSDQIQDGKNSVGKVMCGDPADLSGKWSLTGELEQTYHDLFDSDERSGKCPEDQGVESLSFNRDENRDENRNEIRSENRNQKRNENDNSGLPDIHENHCRIDTMPIGRSSETVLLGERGKAYPELCSMDNSIAGDIAITKDICYIGRLEGQVDYIIKNNAVGKVHATISRKEGTYQIRDLNSRNGTYINNERICSNIDYEIKHNDKITFANTDFIFTFPPIV